MSERRSGRAGRATTAVGASPERRRAHALGDAALIAEMREGDPWAWGEFVARFQPVLEIFARRVGIPAEERAECIEEVLTDEALRFTERDGRLPENLGAYLMRSVRHKYLRMRRGRSRRVQHYASAADEAGPGSPETVVRSACSEHSLRMVREPTSEALADDSPASVAISRLSTALGGLLTPEEEQLLCWHGEQVPHREIAAWLGVSYDAATKRIWRLCQKAKALARNVVRDFPPTEREALARLFARAEVESGERARTGTDRSPGHE